MTGNQNTFQATWLCICFYLTVALETIFYSKLPIHAKSGNNRDIFFANHHIFLQNFCDRNLFTAPLAAL